MTEPLDQVIEGLLKELEQQQTEVRETKRIINTLLRRAKKDPMFDDADEPATSRVSGVLKPDQFYGKPLATAAREALEIKRQATPPEEIISLLVAGGFDFPALGWKDNDRLRVFTLTLAKNTAAFHRLPNGMYGLTSWYPDAIKKKQIRKAEKDAAPGDAEPTEEEVLTEEGQK